MKLTVAALVVILCVSHISAFRFFGSSSKNNCNKDGTCTNIKSDAELFIEGEKSGKSGKSGNQIDTEPAKRIVFKDSKLKTVPKNAFTIFPHAESVDMTNSLITTLTALSFNNGQNLKEIILSDNNIQKVDANVFQKAPKTEYLYMNDSRVASLDKDAFKGMSNLKLLSLEGNTLTDLPVGVFDDLVNLEHINLSKNKLVKLHNGIFDKCRKLKHIDVSDNRLTDIDENVFKNMGVIEFLDVSNNKLDDFVISVTKIEKLDARNSHIKRFHVYGDVNKIMVDGNYIENSHVGKKTW